jgi:maltose-binding protein MalE
MKNLKITILLLLTVALVCLTAGCGKENKDSESDLQQETTQTESVTSGITEDITLNLWYTESAMQDYLEMAAERFHEENPGVEVVLKLCSATNYLENINSDSIKRTNVTDVYMLPSEKLEQAYLAGLALAYDPQDTPFTEENFCSTALATVTYKEKSIAYPLCFDSAFLVYNHAYTSQAPATFDELLDFANNFEVEDGAEIGAQLEKVLIWNVSDINMNYQFLSKSFQIGGVNGDDRNNISVYHANVIKGLEYYKGLSDFFAVDRSTITDDEVVEYFISGKAAFMITDTAGLTRIHVSGMDFGVCAMPDITDALQAGALSQTQTLVVNPYSEHIDAAQSLVQALAYDYVDDFYVKTGYFPSRYTWNYDSEMVRGVYENYADSESRPKLMNMGDLYTRLEILLHEVWDNEDSTESLLMEFQQHVKEQLEQ